MASTVPAYDKGSQGTIAVTVGTGSPWTTLPSVFAGYMKTTWSFGVRSSNTVTTTIATAEEEP